MFYVNVTPYMLNAWIYALIMHWDNKYFNLKIGYFSLKYFKSLTLLSLLSIRKLIRREWFLAVQIWAKKTDSDPTKITLPDKMPGSDKKKYWFNKNTRIWGPAFAPINR